MSHHHWHGGAACTRFDAREIDAGVLKEFKDSYLSAASYDWTDEELLYQVGAISREGKPEAWTHAGTLFFSANPQRVLSHAHIRLLRFEAPIADRDERPSPTVWHCHGNRPWSPVWRRARLAA